MGNLTGMTTISYSMSESMGHIAQLLTLILGFLHFKSHFDLAPP